jgi:hypothetical protein
MAGNFWSGKPAARKKIFYQGLLRCPPLPPTHYNTCIFIVKAWTCWSCCNFENRWKQPEPELTVTHWTFYDEIAVFRPNTINCMDILAHNNNQFSWKNALTISCVQPPIVKFLSVFTSLYEVLFIDVIDGVEAWRPTFTLYRIDFHSDVKKHLYLYHLGTLFSDEILQWRYVVSLCFWKLYIPYQIGSFSRHYRKLSGKVYIVA